MRSPSWSPVRRASSSGRGASTLRGAVKVATKSSGVTIVSDAGARRAREVARRQAELHRVPHARRQQVDRPDLEGPCRLESASDRRDDDHRHRLVPCERDRGPDDAESRWLRSVTDGFVHPAGLDLAFAGDRSRCVHQDDQIGRCARPVHTRSAAAVVVCTVGVLLGAFAGTARATTGPAPYAIVNVRVTDQRITLSKMGVHDVTYVDFLVRNAGKVPHNFGIGGLASRTVRPGQTVHLIVSFPCMASIGTAAASSARERCDGSFQVDRPLPPG